MLIVINSLLAGVLYKIFYTSSLFIPEQMYGQSKGFSKFFSLWQLLTT